MGCSSVEEYLPTLHEALGSLSSTEEKKKKKLLFFHSEKIVGKFTAKKTNYPSKFMLMKYTFGKESQT